MKIDIDSITKHLSNLTDDGTNILYRWDMCREPRGTMVKADTVTLTVIHKTRGEFHFDRMFGAMSRNEYGRLLVFSPGNVKIRSGNRKNAIVRPSGLEFDESFRQAGKHKVIRYNTSPDSLHDSRKKDIILAENLYNITNPWIVPCILGPGRLYMTFREKGYEEQLRVRSNCQITHDLVNSNKYDEDLPVVDNVLNFAKEVMLPMPLESRVAFPFDLFDGTGVPAFRDNPAWMARRRSQYSETEWIKSPSVETSSDFMLEVKLCN